MKLRYGTREHVLVLECNAIWRVLSSLYFLGTIIETSNSFAGQNS